MSNPQGKSDANGDVDLPKLVAGQLHAARQLQRVWFEKSLAERLRIVGRLAHLIARDHSRLSALINRPNASIADKLSSEIMPLADACRYAARRGMKVLAARSLPRRDCPKWLGDIDVSISREPWGIVLVIAPWNYPLFLPGVQLVQAIAAGNAVLLKAAPGCNEVVSHLVNLLTECGMTDGLVQHLPSSVAAASEAIAQGVDKVVLTGSSTTGRKVSEQLVKHLTPATMELSGCDAVFVLPDADLKRVADALAFGLQLNGGATCIAPRRVFITAREQAELEPLLVERLSGCHAFEIHSSAWPAFISTSHQAIDQGARIVLGSMWLASTEQRAGPVVLSNVLPKMQISQCDIFAPVLSLIEASDMTTAIKLNQACPYALCAAIFGPTKTAEYWSQFVNAGCITINDLIAPTADPRVTFGGRSASGYGVTRGLEGLLEMTRPKIICTRRSNWLPHLAPTSKNLESTLVGFLKLSHGGSLRERMSGLSQLLRGMRKN